jgi:glycosyltransferase involved in cell wall biosynthesis
MIHSTKPLKVMHIIARLNIGGAAPYVILLAQAQNAKVVCGVVGENEGDMRYLADQRGVNVTVVPSLGREISPLRDLLTIFTLWRIIRREKPDVVHTHTAKAGFVGRIAAWLARVPVIVHTYHGHVFSGYFGKRKTQLYIFLERLCARLTNVIITLSPALKHELVHVYRIAPEDRFEVVPLGFELEPFAALKQDNQKESAFRKRHNIPTTDRLIGIVGRIVPIKNHVLFLSAATQVVLYGKHLNVMFTIVGDGELRKAMEHTANILKIREYVVFAGWYQDVLPVYEALDVLVLCSDNEGLPVSLIEALAAGVPVIATRVGGVPDLLEGGRLGRIVSPGNEMALAEAIDAAIDDPFPGTSREAVQREILEKYSITNSAAKTDALYRDVYQRMVRRNRE